MYLSNELEFRQQLIQIFLNRAIEIASSEILSEHSYFGQYIARMNDTEFVKAALDEDKSSFMTAFLKTFNQTFSAKIYDISNIKDEDRRKLYQVTTKNETFNISLNQLAHAKDLNIAGNLLAESWQSNEQIILLAQQASVVADKKPYSIKQAGTIDHEYLYVLAILCRADSTLKKMVMQIQTRRVRDKKILTGYIFNLKRIMKYFSSITESYSYVQENMMTRIIDVYCCADNSASSEIISNDDGREERYQLSSYDKCMFHDFMKQESLSNTSFFTMKLIDDKFCFKARYYYFKNKMDINQFKESLFQFAVRFRSEFNNQLCAEEK